MRVIDFGVRCARDRIRMTSNLPGLQILAVSKRSFEARDETPGQFKLRWPEWILEVLKSVTNLVPTKQVFLAHDQKSGAPCQFGYVEGSKPIIATFATFGWINSLWPAIHQLFNSYSHISGDILMGTVYFGRQAEHCPGGRLGLSRAPFQSAHHAMGVLQVGIEDATVNNGTSLCQKERRADSDEKAKKINKWSFKLWVLYTETPVIKHCNGKYPLYYPFKPPFIGDFPLPRLITGG